MTVVVVHQIHMTKQPVWSMAREYNHFLMHLSDGVRMSKQDVV